MADLINHPEHYTYSRIEVTDAIIAWGLSFTLGNVVKYVARCDHKGAPIQDLKKARWYLEREIRRREDEACNNREPVCGEQWPQR